MILRVGLSGGIACGKSHVLRRLAGAGLAVLDLDSLAHAAMAPGGDAYDDVVAAFGATILAGDGSIDRKALGAIVFADPASRERLNALVHPRVRAEEARRVAALEARPGAVVVTDAALLVESGFHLRFDRLVVVHCRPEAQLQRLMQRDRIDAAAATARIASQMPVAEKRRFAHYEIDTSGTKEETDRAADLLARELQLLAAQRRPSLGLSLSRALGSLALGPGRGPRGLSPLRLLLELGARGGAELEPLARLLQPPASGPWYRAAGPGGDGPAPASLVAPLALWALCRAAPDPPFLCAAAASLARLTHRAPAALADACFQALLVQETLVSGRLAREHAQWVPLVERWGGAPPSAAALAVPGLAGSGGPRDGEPGGELSRMLAGALRGASEAEAGPELCRAVKALASREGAALVD